jgi:hypothetical protein
MSEEQGTFWATFCTTQALIGKLVDRSVLSPDDVIDLIGDAEGFLAGLDPALMSPGARDYAKTLLHRFGKISTDDS